MRLIKTGVDADGLSCVVSVDDSVDRGILWETPSFPPDLGYVRPKSVDVEEIDVGLVPGTGALLYASFPPGHRADVHRFDGFSILTIFRGAVTLKLQKESIELTVGDVVMFPAVIHGWETGDVGCEFTSVRFGVGRP
jgi:hypothetical protein